MADRSEVRTAFDESQPRAEDGKWTDGGGSGGGDGAGDDGGAGAAALMKVFESKTLPLRKKSKFGDEVVALVGGKLVHGIIHAPGSKLGMFVVKTLDGGEMEVAKSAMRMPKGGHKQRGAEAAPTPEDIAFARSAVLTMAQMQLGAGLRAAYDPDQPRDDRGMWTSAGGFEHTGIEWTQKVDKDGRPIPIKVKTVEEAAALVLDGKVVELPDVKSAYTLLDKLATMANEAKAAGKEAKNFDLCSVSVAGTNLFCSESKGPITVGGKFYPHGIPRIEMPQMGGKAVPGSEADHLPKNKDDEVDGSEVFMNHLQSIGVKTTREVVPAASLRASQRELVGVKVAGMMSAKNYDPGKKPIFISKDGYVIDGHHRFAAVIGRDAADGKLGGLSMNVVRVNAPISEVLHLANAWSAKFGIAQKAAVVKQAKALGKK